MSDFIWYCHICRCQGFVELESPLDPVEDRVREAHERAGNGCSHIPLIVPEPVVEWANTYSLH